jgi:hypothetical protein
VVGECIAMTTGDRPFIGSEAVASGTVRPHQLRSRFRSAFPNVYIQRHVEITLRQRTVAAWLWTRRQGVVAGLTAAAWHGSNWVDDCVPIELIWSNLRPPPGIRTYDVTLDGGESRSVAGVRVTTPERTAFDIGRGKNFGAAVAQLDSLARATGVKVADTAELAGRHRGARGLRQLETALDMIEPGAQSPKETWLRLLLIGAGLPRPTTQIPVMAADDGRVRR